ncbi:MAG TPA: tRNA epoxyqueuosine(34) reductase QueG [Candidatus Acidoferrales bacterium]|nr:tRNA epoxyqueuosine(34) reductase QueG [Candidatus Acidoferrales bacterium]
MRTVNPLQTRRLAEHARSIGFELCGVAPAEEFEELRRLPEWLERGYAGEMRYLHDARRASAENVLPGTRSVIVCALNYNAALPYSMAANAIAATLDEINEIDEADARKPRGWISRYAWGDDYHDVMKRKLEELLAWMRTEFGDAFQARSYVDTGPVLERVAAKYAGLGWLAKNTCLINQHLGSWLFLGVILTDLELAPSLSHEEAPPADMCGSCRRCIDACPTEAIVAPYVLDARRCIAYLTIELRGPIPREFRPAMGNMVFGCDICQDVCPWNRKAPATQVAQFLPRQITANTFATIPNQDSAPDEKTNGSLFAPPLDWLLWLDEEEFRKVFRGSPVKRTKWRGLIRNVCVALGNSRIIPDNPVYGPIIQRLEQLATGDDATIAEHAQWALERLQHEGSDRASKD